MSKNKRLNRDHAKKTQRPMVEDEVIANQLEALITPAITAQENYYRQLKLRDRIRTPSIDGGCGLDFVVEGCGIRDRIN